MGRPTVHRSEHRQTQPLPSSEPYLLGSQRSFSMWTSKYLWNGKRLGETEGVLRGTISVALRWTGVFSLRMRHLS